MEDKVNSTGNGIPESNMIHRDPAELDTESELTGTNWSPYPQHLEVLYELNRALTTSLRLSDIYSFFAYHASRLLPYDRLSIALAEQDKMKIAYVADGDDHQRSLPVGTELSRRTSAVGWVLTYRQPLLRHNIESDTQFDEDRQLANNGIRSSMIIPLWVKGEVIGTLNIGKRGVSAYDPNDIAVAQSMANPLATAIGNAWLYKQAKEEISERQQAEAALRESEERYRTLFEQANDAILLVNDNGQIIDVNSQACKLLGYSCRVLSTIQITDLQSSEAT